MRTTKPERKGEKMQLNDLLERPRRVDMRAQRNAAVRGVELFMIDHKGAVVQLKAVELVPLDADVYADPLVTIGEDAAQNLIDDLWNAGFRPSEAKTSAGALTATQAHLEDMRRIANRAVDLLMTRSITIKAETTEEATLT